MTAPTFHLYGADFPLAYAQDAYDGQHFLERLGDHEQWTTRWRVETCVPVPLMTAGDWTALDALLGGAR